MSPAHLTVADSAAHVADPASLALAAASAEAHAEELRARARVLAFDQLQGVQRLLEHLSNLSQAASHSDLPLGVRELCRQIAGEATFRSQTLAAVVARTADRR
jgi:hypothetical protein